MKRGYWIIQLLLVIIALGLLMLALAIELKEVTKVSRDTWRIADAAELSVALSAYYFDFNHYPSKWAASIDNSLHDHLVPSYLALMTKDPESNAYFDDLGTWAANTGFYSYLPGSNGNKGTFLIMAKMETQSLANIHFSGPFSGQKLNSRTINWYEIEQRICTTWMIKVERGKATLENPCEYEDPEKLRYIIVKHND